MKYFILVLFFIILFNNAGYIYSVEKQSSFQCPYMINPSNSTTSSTSSISNTNYTTDDVKLYSLAPHLWMNTDQFFNFSFDGSIKMLELFNASNVKVSDDYLFDIGLKLKREKFIESVEKTEFKEKKTVTQTDVVIGQYFKIENWYLNVFENYLMKKYEKAGNTSLFEYSSTMNITQASLNIDFGYKLKLPVFELYFFCGYIPSLTVSDTGNWDIKNVDKFSYSDRKYNASGWDIIGGINFKFIEFKVKYISFTNKVKSSGAIVERASGVFPFIDKSANYDTNSLELSVTVILESMNLGTTNMPMLPALVFSYKKDETIYNGQPGTTGKRFDVGMEFKIK